MKKKEKIVEILTETMAASKNRDWDKQANATKKELETMRKNNYNDFSQIATQILTLFEAEIQKACQKTRQETRQETMREVLDLIDKVEI